MTARNLEIDKLRAVAILMVLVVHFPGMRLGIASLKPWTGVDLFFVISGFIVARTFLPGLRAALANAGERRGAVFATHILAFFCRRLFRLMPILICGLVFSAFAYTYADGLATFRDKHWGREIFGILTYTYNLIMPAKPRLGWHWSLSLEEQFYLLLPLFLALVPGDRARIRWTLAAVLAWPVLMFGRIFPGEPEIYQTQYRCFGILCGLLLALAADRPWFAALRPRALASRPLAAFATTSSLCIAIAFAPGLLGGNASTFLVVGVAGAALVALASFSDDVVLPMPHPALDAALRWIGTRSYAIYLLHLPIGAVLQRLAIDVGYGDVGGARDPLIGVIRLVAIGIVAEAAYRWIERPFMARGARRSTAILARGAAVEPIRTDRAA